MSSGSSESIVLLPAWMSRIVMRAARVREAVDLLDQVGIGALAMHSVLAGLALGDRHDEVQRRLHRRRGIGGAPLADDGVELGEHLIVRDLAEDSHPLREWIAVERDDTLAGRIEPGSGSGPWTGHLGILEAGADRDASEKLSA